MSNSLEIPSRPPGIQVERWDRMCAHARYLVELERADLLNLDGANLAGLRQAAVAGKAIETWRQFPLALNAVRELIDKRETFEKWCRDNPDEFLNLLAAALRNQSTRRYQSDSDAWTRRYDGTCLGHSRVQYAVGQGGFHAGGLTYLKKGRPALEDWARRQRVEHADFLYVYDCGSSPQEHAEREVATFIKRCRRKRIELLFLSHFDADHISGVASLIGDGALTVETIVLPYIDDLERVIAFARAAANGKPVRAFFQELVIDLVGTLRSRGVQRILFVGDEGDLPFDGLEGEPPAGGPDSVFWELRSRAGGVPDVRVGRAGEYVARDVSFRIGSRPGTGADWRLLPYVRRADEDSRLLFAQVVETLLDWPEDSFEYMMRDVAERRRVVMESADVLGDAYRYVFGSKNATTLSLYSGPADPESTGSTVIKPRLARSERSKVAWLGTGDAPLRRSEDIDAFEIHYGNLLDDVSTFMLPHHGSIHNSNPERLIADADIYFAAAQPRRKDWKHPAPKLRDAVLASQKQFHKVGSALSSRLEEVMILFLLPPAES